MVYKNESFERIRKVLNESTNAVLAESNYNSVIYEFVQHFQRNLSAAILPRNILSESMAKTLTSFSSQVAASLNAPFIQLSDSIAHDLQESFKKLIVISNPMLKLPELKPNSITFTNDRVIISNIGLQNISKAIDIPSNHKEIQGSEESLTSFSLKEFFISILFPLILAIMPMAQSAYLDGVNDIESEKHQLSYEDYNDRLLQLEESSRETDEEILKSIQQIMDALIEIQESEKAPEDSAKPQHSCQTDSLASEESARPDDVESGESDNPDSHTRTD